MICFRNRCYYSNKNKKKHHHGKNCAQVDGCFHERKKREVAVTKLPNFASAGSPYQIQEDLIVPANHILRIPSSVKIAFANNVGIIVYGENLFS